MKNKNSTNAKTFTKKLKLSAVDHVNNERKSDKSSDYSVSVEQTPKKRARHSNWEENAADRLRNWAKSRDDVYSIEEFIFENDIPEKTWDDGVARNETLRAAQDYALMKCGLNKEKLAIKRGENISSTNSFTLPQFLKRYKREHAFRAELKNKEEADKKQNITVVIEPFGKKNEVL